MGPPTNGQKTMGNWSEKTLLIGVITPLITGAGAHLAMSRLQFFLTNFGNVLNHLVGVCCCHPNWNKQIPPRSLTYPLKNGGWKTILSYWVSGTFQGRTVKLREGMVFKMRIFQGWKINKNQTKSSPSCTWTDLQVEWKLITGPPQFWKKRYWPLQPAN